MPFHEQQLQFVVWVSQLRGPVLDLLFRFFGLFDSIEAVSLIAAAVTVGFSYRWGIRLSYLIVISYAVNYWLKIIVGWPRPSQEIPGLGMLDFSNNGFPSGGAQMSFVFGALLIYYGKSRLTTIIGVVYILLISFSRIYLGVHFPGDVLGGWTVGFILILLFIRFIEPSEEFLKKQGYWVAFTLSQALPILYMILFPEPLLDTIPSLAFGLGACLSLKYHLYLPPPKTLLIAAFRVLVALVGIFLIYLSWPKDWFSPLEMYLIPLWGSLAASPVCKLLMNLRKRSR